jgi:hypothetical protein
LLARHERGDDYCVVFEHHDDVLFLDNADAPTRIEFFQVKTHDRDWTVTALIARPRRSPAAPVAAGGSGPANQTSGQADVTELSIIGKLYDNWLKYGDDAHALTLVTNRPVGASCRLVTGTDRNRFCATALEAEDWEKLVEAIRAEHGESAGTGGLGRLHVVRTEIPIGEGRASVHSLGELAAFLDRLAPGRRIPVAALHRAIMSELARRNTFEGVHRTYPDLLAHQGLSRAEFDNMLRRAGITDDPEAAWSDVRTQLVQERWPFLRLRDLHTAWVAYEVDRMDGTNAHLQQQRRRVRDELARRTPGYTGALADLVTVVRAACRTGDGAVPAAGQTDEYVTAMILLELMTRDPADDHPVQAAHPRSPEEAA